MRAVIDTGVLVSALIRPRGTIGATLQALRNGRFIAIYTTDILVEIINVLSRPEFHMKYGIEREDIIAIISLLRLRGELVMPKSKVNACRDPNDNKFLEAAIAGQADCVVSGDADLLVLGGFDGIPILRPAEFLERL